MSHPSKNAAGVDNTFRRKFDREEHLEHARQCEQKQKVPQYKGNLRNTGIMKWTLTLVWERLRTDKDMDLSSAV
ncbi:hypothetical protein ACSBR2_017490 [Camellia fascicularis]